MSTPGTTDREQRTLLRRPTTAVAYVAVVAALVTGVIHLLLAVRVWGFDQTRAVVFALNGLGFVGGTGLFLTRYWRRALSLVAVGYALVTILAFFALDGPVNAFSVASKLAEAVLAVAAASLYRAADRA